MNDIEIMITKNRISKLSGKNAVGNMRIINNEETGDLSLINEKGTIMEGQEAGTILGVVEAVDTVVFFIKNVYTGKDSIKIYDGNDISTLYEGNLNML